MKRASKRPAAIVGLNLNDPSCGFITANDPQTLLSEDATELIGGTATKGVSVENGVSYCRHGALGLA